MKERLALAMVLALLPVAAMAQLIQRPAGDQLEQPGAPGRGRELAAERCSSCHLVSPDQRTPPAADAPSFMAIADRFDQNADRLLAQLLNAPHPPLPSPPLDRQQWRDVVAYMVSFGAPTPSHKPEEGRGERQH